MDSKSIKVLLFQGENSPDILKNREKAAKILEDTKKNEVDLVVFPECYLTGFGPHLPDSDFEQVEPSIQFIQRVVDEFHMTAVLPSAVRDFSKNATYNCCYVLQPGKKQISIYKEGLTDSEKNFFSIKTNDTREFILGGLSFQILICKEVSDEPWDYLNPEKMPDVILWPAYWGWDQNSNWPSKKDLALKAGTNAELWKRPILHVNYSKNWRGDPRERGPTGNSMIISGSNSLLKSGAFKKNDLITCELERKRPEETILRI